MSAVADRIRRRRERLEKIGVSSQAAKTTATVHLWGIEDGQMIALNEHQKGSPVTVVAIPTDCYLTEGTTDEGNAPVHVRASSQDANVPPRTPTVPYMLIGAPPNIIPEVDQDNRVDTVREDGTLSPLPEDAPVAERFMGDDRLSAPREVVLADLERRRKRNRDREQFDDAYEQAMREIEGHG